MKTWKSLNQNNANTIDSSVVGVVNGGEMQTEDGQDTQDNMLFPVDTTNSRNNKKKRHRNNSGNTTNTTGEDGEMEFDENDNDNENQSAKSIMKALVETVLTETGYSNVRAAKMDMNDFLCVLAAFNAKGVHFT